MIDVSLLFAFQRHPDVAIIADAFAVDDVFVAANAVAQAARHFAAVGQPTPQPFDQLAHVSIRVLNAARSTGVKSHIASTSHISAMPIPWQSGCTLPLTRHFLSGSFHFGRCFRE